MEERQPNPYRPGFNQPPVVFAGRADVLDGASEALEVAAYDGRTPRPLVLVGPRGVGKTVTLGEIAELAATRHSWPTVHLEAKTGADLIGELCSRLRAVTRLLDGETTTERRRRARVTGGKLEAKAFGVGGEVQLEAIDDDRRADLARDLRSAMEHALARDAGVVVTLDELHTADPAAVHQLAGTLQEAVPENWPLVVAIAALPGLRSGRGRRRLPTYLERAEWHELDALTPQHAWDALTGPAAGAGRPMSNEAARALLAVTGGYPYALQVAGHFAWRASHNASTITLAHAEQAIPRIDADLEQLFKNRWGDTSPKEREYLRAMAAARVTVGRHPTGGEVARQLGVPASKVSYLRERLLKKGTIYRDSAGRLRFITPGMSAWVSGLDED